MSAITTHVLDVSAGRPAAGVEVLLERQQGEGLWDTVNRGLTDADGRLRSLMPEDEALETGVYRLTFFTGAYFASRDTATFYPLVSIVFAAASGEPHYHVPLLVSPFGYSTYRGS